ncbi:MAG TPA: glycosyltransferase family 9 protein [Burkholderiales bacterium]|nr:glycosyltransferase family 9 protein [Burkholderiales bacterium]
MVSSIVAAAAMFAYAVVNGTLRACARLLWPGARPAKPASVCIFRIGNIGDIACALPAMRAVRKQFPDARLTLLSSPGELGRTGAKEVLSGADWIDELLIYHRHDIDSLAKRWTLLKALRRRKFDIWIELPNNLTSIRRQFRDMLFTRLAAVRWARGWRIDTIHWGAQAQSEHLLFCDEVERTLRIVRDSGIAAGEPDYGLARGTVVMSRVDRRLETVLREGKPLVAIAPGAKRPTNLWPVERFAEVGRYLVRAGASIVIIGGESEVETCVALAAAVGADAHFLESSTVEDSCEVLRRCRALVCVDSGAQHLAAAVGTPCLSLFSCWQMRGKWRPHGERHVVIQKRVDCHTCLLERCPRDNHCMKDIRVADVVGVLADRFQFLPPARTAPAAGAFDGRRGSAGY